MRSLLAALVVCAGLGACSSSNRADADDSNTLTIEYGGDAYLLGPAGDDTPKFLVFLPLARWDNSCRTGEHVGLAERWEYTPDRRRWTFHLRPNLRWHDGVPVTARDIEFSINLWKHPDVLWYGAAPVDSVDVIDDYTVTLFARGPLTYSDLNWDVYYPKHLLEDLDPKGFFTWDFWTRPVGNGPYRYVRHDPETHIEFEANVRHAFFRDKEIRQALTMAIDRPALLAALNLPGDIIITDAPVAARHHRERLPEPLPYDPAGARTLLAEAGWLPGVDGVGVPTHGDSLRFQALVMNTNVSEQSAVIVQASLRRIGVDMQIRPLDGGLVRSRVRSGDFDAAFHPLWNHVDGYLNWFGAEGPLAYQNAEVPQLLRSIKVTMDPEQLDGIYRQLTTIIQRDIPVTFLFSDVRSYVVPRWLQGLESPYRADPMQFSERTMDRTKGLKTSAWSNAAPGRERPTAMTTDLVGWAR